MTKEFRFHFTPKGKYQDEAHRVRLDESDFQSTTRRLGLSVLMGQDTPEWADDLLRIARAAWLVDRRVPRKYSEDGWTRTLHLSVQVIDTSRWDGAPLEILNSMLRSLTSDRWHITVHNGARPLNLQQQRLSRNDSIEEVALFSGGLDSTAYAAQQTLIDGGTLLLIGQDFSGDHVPQENLYKALLSLSERKRKVDLRRLGDKPKRTLERTTRSRGFLFAATGVYAAATHEIQKVAMPENGQLAINPPLIPGRLAACSTRSVHPWILDKINMLIKHIEGNVTIHNPFLWKTKGDVCKVGSMSGLSNEHLAKTISCGAPKPIHKYQNCGYCYPCLIRRSGLLTSLGTDPTHYKEDLQTIIRSKKTNLVDLQRWLSHPFKTRNLIEDLPMPIDINLQSLMTMLRRGREELIAMLREQIQWTPPE